MEGVSVLQGFCQCLERSYACCDRAMFQDEQVCDPGTEDSPEFLENLEVTCSSSGGGYIIFGDNEGYVSFVKRNFQVSFRVVIIHKPRYAI